MLQSDSSGINLLFLPQILILRTLAITNVMIFEAIWRSRGLERIKMAIFVFVMMFVARIALLATVYGNLVDGAVNE